MIFGIVGVWPFTILASFVALPLGYSAKQEIDRSGGTQTGRGLAVAGIVLGWVMMGVLALLIILLIGYIASCSRSNCG